MKEKDPLRLPSRGEIKAMIRMELWHVLGRIFDFTPAFIDGPGKHKPFDWRCVPVKMYTILNCQDVESVHIEIKKREKKHSGTLGKRHRLFILQSGACFYCRRKTLWKDWTIDHVVPVSKGGKRNAANETGACSSCNGKKGNKSAQEFQDSEWLKIRTGSNL